MFINCDIERSATNWCVTILREHFLCHFNPTLHIPLNQYNAAVFLSVSKLTHQKPHINTAYCPIHKALCTDFGNNWRKLLVPEFGTEWECVELVVCTDS